MEVYNQIVDPTAVSQSLACNLTSPDVEDLVVAKNTLLQVFRVSTGKLILQHEFKLQGQVLSISKLRLNGNTVDHVAVLTKFAKVSIVGFHPLKNSLTTHSLHYYEMEFKKRDIKTITNAQLRIDPSYRTLLCFHRDLLAFLPFNSDEDLDMDDVTSAEVPTSTIIPSTKLGVAIHNIVDCVFLHNYREPTLAIIYNNSLTWSADLTKEKDTVNLVVLNLDLASGSSTPIVNVENLPYDIWKVIALPTSGLLLIGCNEIIHVDNSGTTRGLGTNVYYSDCTDFKLDDASHLDLFLEESVFEIIGTQVFFTDKTNTPYVISFKMDGKNVRGMEIQKLEIDLPYGLPSTLTFVDKHLFAGSSTADSVLLKTRSTIEGNADSSNPKRLKTEDVDGTRQAVDDDVDVDDDDDLYADDEVEQKVADIHLDFETVDTLINNGPISSFTLATLSPEAMIKGAANSNIGDTSIIATSGTGKSGKLTCINPTIQPIVHSTLKFQNINKSWNLLDKYLVTTDLTNYRSEIFLINDNFKTFHTFDFKNNQATINIAVFEKSRRILQVTTTNVFLFDYTFKKLLQLNTDFEILNAKLYDPYVILTTSKGEIKIFELDSEKGRKLNKIKLPQSIDDFILTFGTMCNTQILSNGSKRTQDGAVAINSNPVFFITTVNNQILAFTKEHNDVVYQISDMHKLTELSEVKPFEVTQGLVPDPFIKELDIMLMGDSEHKEEIMTILTVGGEIIMYRVVSPTMLQKLDSNIFTGAPQNVYPQGTSIERKLIPFTIDSNSYLFVTGKQPYVIMKAHTSHPKIFKFTHTPLISICQYEGKLMAIDEAKGARVCSIPHSSSFNYSNNMPIETYVIGETVNNVAFHSTSNLLVVSTLKEIPYDAKDEEGKDIVGTEENKRRATNWKSSVQLIKKTATEWLKLDEVNFEDDVVVNCVKSLELTISSRSKKKKEFVVLGTARYRLEDLTVLGDFQLYDLINIVPDPDHPDVDYKLKEIMKEVVKGGVTAVSEISGRFLVSQGQKIIIRDLQQDNSTVPVAFLDTATYLSDAKSFENLVLVGDTLKSIWLLGFDAEPYRLLTLGKSLNSMNVSSCDFLVSNGEVHLLVADDEGTLHLVAYDPDDAKSLGGQRLLNRTTLHINTLTTTTRMVQKHEEFNESRSFQVIGANVDGSLFTMTPIDEVSYRRLYILQQQLNDKVTHFCGLNPKANRYHFNDTGVKPVIDYELIRRFFLFNTEKRQQFSGKVGKNAYGEIWRDIIEIENSLNILHPE